jgi:hypothetical protein
MMKVAEYEKYWKPAANRFYLERLAPLLGMQSEYFAFLRRPGQEDWPMSEELKNLLVKLAGPHGKAILKMYRIQRGLE